MVHVSKKWWEIILIFVGLSIALAKQGMILSLVREIICIALTKPGTILSVVMEITLIKNI